MSKYKELLHRVETLERIEREREEKKYEKYLHIIKTNLHSIKQKTTAMFPLYSTTYSVPNFTITKQEFNFSGLVKENTLFTINGVLVPKYEYDHIKSKEFAEGLFNYIDKYYNDYI